MKLKVGDRVRFDWECDYHKDNRNTASIIALFRKYGVNTDKIFIVRWIGHSHCEVEGHSLSIHMARLKRVNGWAVTPRKEVKHV